jgi:hypothetical protein
MARRVRLDVRWDAGTVEAATRLAERRGVKPSVVLREAAEIGLSTLANGDGVRPRVARERVGEAAVADAVVRDASAAGGTVPGAGSGISRPRAGVAAPRPAAPASPAQQVRLEVVVARTMARAARTGPTPAPAPADVARARRLVLAGKVTVGGLECRNPAQLVDPAEVAV